MPEKEYFKRCFACDEVKPLVEFHKQENMHDGHINRCKECKRFIVRKRNREDPKVRAYHRNYIKTNLVARAKLYASINKRAKEYPEKIKARQILQRAVKSGKLVRGPCEVCGKRPAEGHHPDYAKPLDVQWLCTLHHRRLEFSREGV